MVVVQQATPMLRLLGDPSRYVPKNMFVSAQNAAAAVAMTVIRELALTMPQIFVQSLPSSAVVEAEELSSAEVESQDPLLSSSSLKQLVSVRASKARIEAKMMPLNARVEP